MPRLRVLGHGLPSVRREALTSLSVLGHEETSDLALRALSDESGSVSRRAREILRRHRAAILPAQLWSIASGGGPLHGKRNALIALASLGKWRSIAYLVDAAASTGPKLAETAVLLLRRWIQTFNASFATPTPDQVASLRTALAESEPRLPSELVEYLRFLANSASTAAGNP